MKGTVFSTGCVRKESLSKEILKADFVFGYTIRDVNLLYWNKRIAAMKKGKKMERYKVILVDDEAEVIDMIEKKPSLSSFR